jgi:hypothetical protein
VLFVYSTLIISNRSRGVKAWVAMPNYRLPIDLSSVNDIAGQATAQESADE